MLSALIAPLLVAGATIPPDSIAAPAAATAQSAVAAPSTGDPPIRITLNEDRRYEPGDRARVRVETLEDGYLVVLHVDTDGRLRVLFPLDPGDDNFVRGDKRYEIRSRGDREAFTTDETGEGMVYAAVSRDPLRFDGFVRGDHWDYQAFPERVGASPEPELTELVGRMAPRGFEYDALTYRVDRPYERTVVHHYDDHYYGGSYWGGSYWNDCWDCFGHYGHGYHDPFGVRVSVVFGSPYRHRFYDPFWRSYWYDPFYYRPVAYYPVFVYPRGYYPRYYRPYDRGRGFRPGFGDGVGYRDRRFDGVLRATNTVYGQPPARRELGTSPVRRMPVSEPTVVPAMTERGAVGARPRRAEPAGGTATGSTSGPERRRTTEGGVRRRMDSEGPTRPATPPEARPESRPETRPQIDATPRRRDQGIVVSEPSADRERPAGDRPQVERRRAIVEDSPRLERRQERREEPRAEPRREERRAEPRRSEPQRSAPRPSYDGGRRGGGSSAPARSGGGGGGGRRRT
jgi:hypothetical protein